MTYSVADCEGFAGGFTVGAVLNGFRLVGKRELPGAFGAPLMEANRAFLGNDWHTQADEAVKWEPVKSDVMIGNPPCSGFSNFSAGTSIGIGVNSPINECMWAFHRFAARCHPAIVIMESVAQAFSNGQVLMHALSEELRQKSGLAYRTTHVIQDNYSVGGCTLRRRYFLVNSLVPFGVERPDLTWLPSVGDALGDLRDLPVQWDAQHYQSSPTWWSHSLRSKTGTVDGHSVIMAPNMARLAALERDHVKWEPGDRETEMLKKYYEAFGELPSEYDYQSHAGHTRHLTRAKHLLDRGLETGGFGQTKCWDWGKPGRVITGHGPYQVRHPDNRCLTNRETARILGFPDDWLCGVTELQGNKQLHSYWGKGTSVAPAQWITQWAKNALDGQPGSEVGSPLPDGSHFIDISAHWKDAAQRLGLAERFGIPVKPVRTLPLPKMPEARDLTPEAHAAATAAALKGALKSQGKPGTRTRPPLPPKTPKVALPVTQPRTTPKTSQERSKLPALTGKCPGWEYERKPTDGPVWDKTVLDRLVTVAESVTGAGARTGTVAALINSAEFRKRHDAEQWRGCASYHVAQARERRASPPAQNTASS